MGRVFYSLSLKALVKGKSMLKDMLLLKDKNYALDNRLVVGNYNTQEVYKKIKKMKP